MRVTLFRIPLYFLQSSGDPDDFALLQKEYSALSLIIRQGRFLRLGKVPLGIQISTTDMKVFSQICSTWFSSEVSNSCSQLVPASNSFALLKLALEYL